VYHQLLLYQPRQTRYQLAYAFRRLLRPSSPLIAKAFTMCAQMLGDFIANLSVLDMMFTCGAKVRDIVLI
jgi:hypothetical protein